MEVKRVIAKMSKSLKNVVNPDDMISEYGTDALRMYEMVLGDFRDSAPWEPTGIVGVRRFLDRVHTTFTEGKNLAKDEMKTMKLLSVSLCALAFGCSTGDAGTDATPGGSVNVAQGGAQDFAQFRALVEAGKVPTPDTLDPVGFFAEHALDMPKADCGKDVCVHPFLAVAPRFDQTMVRPPPPW